MADPAPRVVGLRADGCSDGTPRKGPAIPPELVKALDQLGALEADAIPGALVLLASAQARLAARQMEATARAHQAPALDDQLLTLKEAAAILCVSPDFLRRSPSMKALRVRLDRELRISSAAVREFIRKSRGRE